ncbi:NAD(P)H-dependent flavin oxidoreductase [Pseudonocardia adelaidensis]|uniref:Nitronate monooxygenase n=1 Tax=Pseudonocardia adelaidensis TaxID=648754 RepID=A0ABP9NVX7_9PSEU
MLSTRFTELVGCDVPIQQAPMGQLAPPGLALAVARAGGVGTVSAPIGAEPEALAAQLDPWMDAGAGTLAVNFVTEQVDPAAVAVAGARARMVDFFWNAPHAKLVEAAHEGGALVNWQVGSLPDAVLAVEAGADVVTVQGREAGGHVRGDTALLPLLTAVLRAVDVPVLAAGGIAEPRALAAVLAAGASGARVGTRFLATPESGAHPEYVLALLAAGPESTEITDGFAECPMCATLPRARVLRSAIAAVEAVDGETVGGVGDQQLPPRAGMPPHKEVQGMIHAMALYAGGGVEHVTAVRPAEDVVRELAEGAEALLRVW